MADERAWDDNTDQFINELDKKTTEQFSISLRTLFTNPRRYSGSKDIQQRINGTRKLVDNYFADMLSSMQDEQAKLKQELESANVQYEKINELISNISLSTKIPYIRPLSVGTNPDTQEEIVIEKYENSTDVLLGKLIGSSNYVADLSTKYREYMLGSWLFSGQKTYLLTLNPPTSLVMIVEKSRDSIQDLLDDASASITVSEEEQ